MPFCASAASAAASLYSGTTKFSHVASAVRTPSSTTPTSFLSVASSVPPEPSRIGYVPALPRSIDSVSVAAPRASV